MEAGVIIAALTIVGLFISIATTFRKVVAIEFRIYEKINHNKERISDDIQSLNHKIELHNQQNKADEQKLDMRLTSLQTELNRDIKSIKSRQYDIENYLKINSGYHPRRFSNDRDDDDPPSQFG